MTTIAQALESLGAKATVRGNVWSGVEFLPGSIQPTEKEVNDEVARLDGRLADEVRIDAAFPKTDSALVIFEAFFEIANRLQAFEGKNPITRNQLKEWLKAKLPSNG